MVVHFDLDALLLQQQADLGADVHQRVGRRHRKIAALHRRPVRQVARVVVDAGRPRRFLRLDLHEGARHVDAPGDRVENEKLRLRAEIGRVAQAARLQVRLAPLGERTRIALIALAGSRLDHIARQNQRVFFAERIHPRRAGVRHQQHVRCLDPLPTGDRRAVESVPIGELVVPERLGGHRDVLLLAPGVGKAQINEFDFVVRDHFHYVFGRRHR
jgi:hypothetical protein